MKPEVLTASLQRKGKRMNFHITGKVEAMETALMKIPMILLTWVSGMLALLMFELTPDLVSRLTVLAGSALTFGAALLRWLKDRKLEAENKRLREKLERNREDFEQFTREREAFRAEVRGEIERLREDRK